MNQGKNSGISAIIFDFGEVLTAPLDTANGDKKREEMARQLGMPAEQVWEYLFEGEAARDWMTGQLNWEEFWTRVLGPRGLTTPAEIEAFAENFRSYADGLNPAILVLIGELRKRYKLAILSNASWTVEELEKILYSDFGLPDDLFNIVITSRAVGAVKPEKAIFQYALTQLNVRPEQAVFIDDSPRFTKGAAQMGIHAHTFTTPTALRGFLEELGVLP